jgi:uncharacterized membrane protein
MTKGFAAAATQWEEQERIHRADKKIVNRKLLVSFALIVFLLVLAVATGTLFAELVR